MATHLFILSHNLEYFVVVEIAGVPKGLNRINNWVQRPAWPIGPQTTLGPDCYLNLNLSTSTIRAAIGLRYAI